MADERGSISLPSPEELQKAFEENRITPEQYLLLLQTLISIAITLDPESNVLQDAINESLNEQ